MRKIMYRQLGTSCRNLSSCSMLWASEN